MTDNIILRPSEYAGYTPFEESSRTRRFRRFEHFWYLVFFVLSVGLFLVLWQETDLFSAVVLGLLCLGLTIGLPAHLFDRRISKLKTKHDHQMMSLIVPSIRNNFSPNSAWWFCPLGSQSECFFITDGALGIINLDTDWALYVSPENLLNYSYEARNLGSTSQTSVSSNTYGYGAGGFIAHTQGQARTETLTHYSHVIDIYTNIENYNHVSLSFGMNEAWAKQAYAKLQDVMSRSL